MAGNAGRCRSRRNLLCMRGRMEHSDVSEVNKLSWIVVYSGYIRYAIGYDPCSPPVMPFVIISVPCTLSSRLPSMRGVVSRLARGLLEGL